jgi:hypothetical protein
VKSLCHNRRELATRWPQEFSWGIQIPIDPLLDRLLKPSLPILGGKLKCEMGHVVSASREIRLPDTCVSVIPSCKSIQEFVDGDMAHESNLLPCQLCHGTVYKRFYFTAAPQILSFLVEGTEVEPNRTLTISTKDGNKVYHLKGIVYYHQHHFTARIFCCGDMVWFHDGLEPDMKYEGLLTTLPDLCVKGLSSASAAIYFLSDQ